MVVRRNVAILTGFSTAIGAGFKTWLMAIILGFKGFLTGLALIYLINDTRKSKGYKKGLAWCAAGVGVLVYYVTFGLTSDAIKEASSVSITQKKTPKPSTAKSSPSEKTAKPPSNASASSPKTSCSECPTIPTSCTKPSSCAAKKSITPSSGRWCGGGDCRNKGNEDWHDFDKRPEGFTEATVRTVSP